jgi:hypothetical protein
MPKAKGASAEWKHPALVSHLQPQSTSMQQPFILQKSSTRWTYSFLALPVLALVMGLRASADDTPDESASTPPSFHLTLVGISRIDGISFANLLDQQTGNHFLLSTDRKSDFDVTLTSVQTGEDPTGPSATIQKDGVTVLVKLESDVSLDASNFTSSFSQIAPFQPAPVRPRTTSILGGLTLPPGATLPLVFQEVDPKKMTLTDDQKETLNRLRQDFIRAVNGTTPSQGTVNDPTTRSNGNAPATVAATSSPVADPSAASGDQTLQKWIDAQEQSDDKFRTLYGTQAFVQYQESSSYPTPP